MPVLRYLPALAVLMPAAALAFEPGRYEITYRIEMPHLERYGETRRLEACILQPTGIPVASGKGSFAECDLADRREEDGHLIFSRICEGASGARAFARYRFEGAAFTGQIAVKLGAKNMTLTERQEGRHLGDCR